MTPKERADGLINNGKFWQKPATEMARDIEAAITAAVAEEREACAVLMETTDIVRDATGKRLAAAIRARGDDATTKV